MRNFTLLALIFTATASAEDYQIRLSDFQALVEVTSRAASACDVSLQFHGNEALTQKDCLRFHEKLKLFAESKGECDFLIKTISDEHKKADSFSEKFRLQSEHKTVMDMCSGKHYQTKNIMKTLTIMNHY